MGAGAYPAGVGLAGYDPSTPAPLAALHVPPEARFYNPVTHDYLLDGFGQASPMDAVDQGVALSLTVEQGSVSSSPTTGHTLRQIKYLGSEDMQSDVEYRVRNSNPLKRLIENGDVVVWSIKASVYADALYVLVEYRKPKIDPNESRYAQLK